MAANIANTNEALFLNSNGPGTIPCTMKAPRRTAVAPSPGIPKVRRGIIAPPTEALFEVSEATTPSGIPVPNFSGYLDLLFITLYAINFLFQFTANSPGKHNVTKKMSG